MGDGMRHRGMVAGLLCVVVGGLVAVEGPTAAQAADEWCDGTQGAGVVQDIVPWDAADDQHPLGANVTEVSLQREDMCVLTSEQLGAFDLAGFGVLVISSAQTQKFYDNLFPGGVVHPALDAWVRNGGVLVAQLADGAGGIARRGTWAGRTFVGGVTQVPEWSDNNAVVDAQHPVVAGTAPCPSGHCASIQDTGPYEDLDGWNYSSHGYLTGLPSDAVLGGPDLARPVLVDYAHGAGRVIATMVTVEFRYVGGWSFGDLPQNKALLANQLAYAFAVASELTVSPAAAQAPAVEGRWHAVTATLVDPDSGAARSGAPVTFAVTAGPNAGVQGRCSQWSLLPYDPLSGLQVVCETDGNGQVTWYYRYGHPTGAELGVDRIRIEAEVGEGPSATATVRWLEPVDYRALGDSFSAGLGVPPYFHEAPAFEGPRECSRSQRAYATRTQPPGYDLSVYELSVAADGVGWHFAACSGAEIRHVLDTEQEGEPPQVQRLDSTASLVTVTIGATTPATATCSEAAWCGRAWTASGVTGRRCGRRCQRRSVRCVPPCATPTQSCWPPPTTRRCSCSATRRCSRPHRTSRTVSSCGRIVARWTSCVRWASCSTRCSPPRPPTPGCTSSRSRSTSPAMRCAGRPASGCRVPASARAASIPTSAGRQPTPSR